MSLVFTGGGFIIIPSTETFAAQGELVFLKIAVNFLLDGITDAVLEEIQSFLALGSDGQVGPGGSIGWRSFRHPSVH